MTRGRNNGPRQPGGGRQQVGPRQRQHSSRSAKGEGHPNGQARFEKRAGTRAPLPPRSEAERRGGVGGGGHLVRSHAGKREPTTPAPAAPTVPTARKASRGEGQQALQAGRGETGKVQTLTVTPDESGMRVDRFFEARFP